MVLIKRLESLKRYVPIIDGAVVALDHKGAAWGFVFEPCGARGSGDLDILVDRLAVVDDFFELGVGNLFARSVEFGGAEDYVESLPLARGQ